MCPQMFIVKILIIRTSATTGFYSRTERRGNRHVAVETKRESERGCVCIARKRGWRPLKDGRLAWLVCELLFTTLFIQETYLHCEKGERKGRGRKILKLTR